MTLDSIDRLLELLDLQTRIEVYCHLQAPFHMVHEPDTPGTAWFHLLLEGSCTIATGGHQYALQAGDFFMLTAGSQHTIYAGEGNGSFREDTRNGLLQLCNDSGGEPLRMLCGFYQVRNRAAVSLLGILPEPLLVSLGDIPQLPALCTLIHHEALARREGSLTIVRALCEILLLLALRHISELPEKHRLTALFSDPGLARALARILADPFAPYTTEGLAEIACMSRANSNRQRAAAYKPSSVP